MNLSLETRRFLLAPGRFNGFPEENFMSEDRIARFENRRAELQQLSDEQ